MSDKVAELRAKRKGASKTPAKTDDVVIEMEDVNINNSKDEELQNKKLNEEMKVFEDIKNGVNIIRRNIIMINELKTQSNKEANPENFKNIMKKLDSVMNESKGTAAQIKTSLKNIEEVNTTYPPGTILQQRSNMLQTYTRTFADAMKEYSEASSSFQSSLKSRIARQAQIIKPDITEDEVEKISQDPQAFLQGAMLNRAVIDVVSDIEDKHARIMEIERSVHYINELFHDLATLVNLQQEHLDLIEENVQQTKNLTTKGASDIKDAADYQKKSRTTQCCIVIILMVILCVILFPTLAAKGVFKSA